MGPQGRVERRLAAILSADVVGYSRLMGADEEGTLAALSLNPAITTRHTAGQIPYKNPADLKRLFDALEKAGLAPQA